MFQMDTYITSHQKLIDALLEERMPTEDMKPTVLAQAMRYSVFSGGKRFRPIISLAAAECVTEDSSRVLLPACAIELLHTYSLIHDDLPALDNDVERRGKPTSHVKFGEANAILAGDGLLTLAFEWMAQADPASPYSAAQLCVELAVAAGSEGMVGGQVEDMLAQGQAVHEEELLFIHQRKTVALVRASIRIGAMVAGASEAQLVTLTRYAEALGMLYQIVDDIEDSREEESSDIRLQKLTAVNVYGLEGAHVKARAFADLARTSLEAEDFLEGGKQALLAAVDLKLNSVS